MSPPKEHAKQSAQRIARIAVIALAVISAIETVAGAGAAVIVIGEALKLWDLL